MILFIFIQLYVNSLFIKDGNNFITLSFSPPLNYRRLSEDNLELQTFSATIPGDYFSNLNSDIYNLIVNRLTGQAYKVYFNDILIGSLGDLTDGRSNIWNSISTFTIPNSKIEDINTITIEI